MQAQPPAKDTTVKGGVDLEKVREKVAPVLAAHRVELVDIEWLTERAGWTLRVTIERVGTSASGSSSGLRGATSAQSVSMGPQAAPNPGGVTLDDCVEVSRDISAVLDVEDLIPHHYSLEVSSPGLDRKLRGPSDFVRFRGQRAKLKLTAPAPDGQRVLRGVLEEAPEGMVAVIVDGKRIEVPIGEIGEAQLVYELSTTPKKAPSSRKRKRTKDHSGA
jgi:ribosome maturation factor RimP